MSCYLNIFLLVLKRKVLEESIKKKKTEFAKAFLIILYKPRISYKKKKGSVLVSYFFHIFFQTSET